MNDNIKKLNKIMLILFFSYVASALIIILSGIISCVLNGETIFETLMLNVRSFMMGIISPKRKGDFIIVDSIGLFAPHLIAFFGLFFYAIFYLDELNVNENALLKNKLFLCIIVLIFSMVLILTKTQPPLCIHLGLFVSSVLYLITQLISLLKIRLPINILSNVFMIICILYTIFSVGYTLINLFVEF